MERFIGLAGMAVLLGIAYALSVNRKAIRWKTVAWGLGLQFGLAILVLWTEPGRWAIAGASRAVAALLGMAQAGSEFLFGSLGQNSSESGVNGVQQEFFFAFQVLPVIIFIAAFFSLLYYWGVMQFIVRALAKVMTRLMGTSGAESLNAAASIFMGQTESPLTIRPYLSKLTDSELMTVMTAGMATVQGGILIAYVRAGGVQIDHLLMAVVMAAPAALALGKMMVPETGTPLTAGVVRLEVEREDENALGAIARGTTDGLHLALNIAAMLISFLALLALANALFGGLHTVFAWMGFDGFPKTLEALLGWFFHPLAWLMGIPWDDAGKVGSLMGLRMVTNEIIAYIRLGQIQEALDPRSHAIATFALCGFANLGSIGMQIGGIGSLAPNRRGDLARLGFRAMLAATIANFMSACVAGMLL